MSAINNQDKELAEFFTDVEHLRAAFKNLVAAQTLTKRILVIHGVGGVGKSSLLKMFRLHCKSVNVPVALASGDDSKSAFDVLTHWTDDLKADNVAFPSFGKTFEHYRATQAKVDTEAQKTRGKLGDLAGKAAGKTAETAAATAVGAALGSIIPGIGTIAGAIGGMGAEALVDWMRGFLTKPDIDLLLDPTKKLTDDFLDDLAKTADKKRIVLMLDTFEQMTALDDWARDVAQRVGQISNLPVGQVGNLSYGVLLVIAGRALPNWGRAWSGWMANAQVEELKPMSEDVMRELIRRYYATMRGGEPNLTQVDAIIRFARGLPMVVTSAVQLWVKYGVEDFQSVKAEIVANLVDRLMEGVPSVLIPALEAAAIVRWFDQPILRAVTGLADVRDVYNELRRFPFVRTRVEGLALHDAVREIMDENLRAQDSERHCELHERAAAYFEKRLEKVADTRQGTTGEEAERLGLERLYHRVRADEEAGIKLFQEMAEELTRYRLVNRLRVLLNDVNTYPLEKAKNKLWCKYYISRLIQLDTRLDEGKSFQVAEARFREIAENPEAESKTKFYALCDLGGLLVRTVRLNEPDGIAKANQILERAKNIMISTDFKSSDILGHIQDICEFQCDWVGVENNIAARLELAKKNMNASEYFAALISRVGAFTDRGHWKLAFDAEKVLDSESRRIFVPEYLKYKFHKKKLHWTRTGRFADSEHDVLKSLEIARSIGMRKQEAHCLSTLGFLYSLQDKETFNDFFIQAQKILEGVDSAWQLPMLYGYWGLVLLRKGNFSNALEMLDQSLIGKIKTAPKDVALIYNWIAALQEVNFVKDSAISTLEKAEISYKKSLEFRWTKREDLLTAALTGLVRVKHAQGDYAAIPPLLAEAEQLAQQYEYNDHLASLRLTQGMTTDVMGLNGQNASHPSVESNQSVVIGFFKQAMIYALRYNRFLLDEVLSGRPQGTPLHPIIPYCLQRGEEGREILMTLRDWWKTGINDIGTPRPDTISPIPEAIALLEAERIAREREPGDGSPQKSVVEQIENALTIGGNQ
jgi:hypothetical protein